ncbi:MAG: HD domain-containing protein [Verrucomicrobia bacterium]|nr:MAG: HD domain-containing protein [Verrucomicrobiota bacterium]
MKPSVVVDEIFRVFRERGHRNYGENVTELQHALQSATFARESGGSPEVVAACLLHDYGHLLHDLGEDIADQGVDARHEHIGANKLSDWFGEAVVEPIRLHAASKRYLCWKEPGYLGGLSPASRKSLALQGGPMNDAEAAEFEAGVHRDPAVWVRRHDDAGKIPGMETPDLEAFRPLLESLVITVR